MRILKNRQITHTRWRLDTSASPGGDTLDINGHEEGGQIFPLSRWLDAIEILIAKDPGQEIEALPGVFLQPDDQVSQLKWYLHKIPVIAIDTSNFADGRIYSLAVDLRQQLGYSGELRAIGATLDNLQLMERCGFDAFELKSDVEPVEALKFFHELPTVYSYNQAIPPASIR